MQIGAVLTKYRNRQRLSQTLVAERIGVSQSLISLWESDGSLPALHHRIRLAEALQIPLPELIPEPLLSELVKSTPKPGNVANGNEVSPEILGVYQKLLSHLEETNLLLHEENQRLREAARGSGGGGVKALIIRFLKHNHLQSPALKR